MLNNRSTRTWIGVVGAAAAVASVVVFAASSANSTSELGSDRAAVVRAQRDVQARLPAASALQRSILADGAVSGTEANRVVDALVQCSSASGVSVKSSEGSSGLEFTVVVPRSADQFEKAEKFDACYAEQFELVGITLGMQRARPAADLKEINAAVVSCLAERGIDASDWPATDAVIDPAVEASCVDEETAVFDSND